MKKALPLFVLSLGFAGCSTSNNGPVSYREDGTKVYNLNPQPQVNVTSDAPRMPALSGYRQEPGQFTGQEGTSGRGSITRTAPAKADRTELTHSNPVPQVGSGIVPPVSNSGAGTLGQSGIQPGVGVSSSALSVSPSSLIPSLSSVSPPTMSSTPTLAEPLTRNAGANIDTTAAAGRPSGAEIGTAT